MMPLAEATCSFDQDLFTNDGEGVFYNIHVTHWRGLPRDPYPLETSLPRVFAAGAARRGSPKRVTSAVGEVSMAVRLVHQYLADAGVREVGGRGSPGNRTE